MGELRSYLCVQGRQCRSRQAVMSAIAARQRTVLQFVIHSPRCVDKQPLAVPSPYSVERLNGLERSNWYFEPGVRLGRGIIQFHPAVPLKSPPVCVGRALTGLVQVEAPPDTGRLVTDSERRTVIKFEHRYRLLFWRGTSGVRLCLAKILISSSASSMPFSAAKMANPTRSKHEWIVGWRLKFSYPPQPFRM